MSTDSELLDEARAWVEADPDPGTRRELAELVDRRSLAELRERFDRPLTFGTAGLRGIVGAGPGRMNRAVVIRTTRALAEYLVAREPDARTLPVVVGYDARLTSRRFAEAVVGVLAAARIPVRYFEEAVPTPLVAYALRQLAGTAGIVITASHNPPEYNGYKLYAANGVQIVPPVDEDIQRRIEAVGPAAAVPIVEGAMSGAGAFASPLPESMGERYLAEVDALRPAGPADRRIKIVYTPLHGVGGALALRALSGAGFSAVSVVAEQEKPDGAFPTVRFPNPEEPGVLELAIRAAEREHADLVLANDPDADRLAVAVPTAAGRWIPLTGNQIGILLADHVLEHAPAVPRPLVVTSIVSTPMVEAVGAAHGARVERSLTGFKWIWSAALHLEQTEGVRFAFGFEEAIGFSVGRIVRDKDGISAAVVFAELAARCRAEGESVLERLERLYRKHGLWSSSQTSVVRPGLDGALEIQRAVAQLAASPPVELAGHQVEAFTDFRSGEGQRPPWLGATPLLVFELGRRGRVLVRPSGTEPKLKIYVDLRKELAPSDTVLAEESALRAEGEALGAAVVSLLGFG